MTGTYTVIWRGRLVEKPYPKRKGGLAPCGTQAAYKRHLSRGEPACDACLRANREKRNTYSKTHRPKG